MSENVVGTFSASTIDSEEVKYAVCFAISAVNLYEQLKKIAEADNCQQVQKILDKVVIGIEKYDGMREIYEVMGNTREKAYENYQTYLIAKPCSCFVETYFSLLLQITKRIQDYLALSCSTMDQPNFDDDTKMTLRNALDTEDFFCITVGATCVEQFLVEYWENVIDKSVTEKNKREGSVKVYDFMVGMRERFKAEHGALQEPHEMTCAFEPLWSLHLMQYYGYVMFVELCNNCATIASNTIHRLDGDNEHDPDWMDLGPTFMKYFFDVARHKRLVPENEEH